MIAFAILMGCNPIYINGMGLDPHTDKGTYAELNKNTSLQDYKAPAHVWKDHRRDWILRDFNIVNESAKNIGTKIINLHPNPWYKIFEIGEI